MKQIYNKKHATETHVNTNLNQNLYPGLEKRQRVRNR